MLFISNALHARNIIIPLLKCAIFIQVGACKQFNIGMPGYLAAASL
jgi:hypothetical protein